MKIKYIIDVSPITDQFVLVDARDGDKVDPFNREVAMILFNECPSESFFSSLAVERIQSTGRHSKELSRVYYRGASYPLSNGIGTSI